MLEVTGWVDLPSPPLRVEVTTCVSSIVFVRVDTVTNPLWVVVIREVVGMNDVTSPGLGEQVPHKDASRTYGSFPTQ